MSVEVKQDHVDELVKAVEALTQKEVLIGIPEDTTSRTTSFPTNSLLGYWHEFGVPASNIPARPFLFPAIKAQQDRITRIMFTTAQKVGRGKMQPEEVDRALNSVGLIASTEAKKIITAGIPPPLRPATLAARRAKKFRGTTPLIVTGQLLRSITYVVQVKQG